LASRPAAIPTGTSESHYFTDVLISRWQRIRLIAHVY